MTLTSVDVQKGSAERANDIYQKANAATTLEGENTFATNWSGEGLITNNGKSVFNADNSQYTGTYIQSVKNAITTISGNGKFFGGTTNIQNGTLNWFTQNDILDSAILEMTKKGNLVVGDNNNTSRLTLNINKTIADDVKVDIHKNSTLVIDGAELTLDTETQDNWAGTVKLESGKLNVKLNSNGQIKANGGILNVESDKLTVGNGSEVGLGTKVILPEASTIDIRQNGIVAINDNDDWNGKIELNGGTLNYGTTQSGTLLAETGNLNLLSDSILDIQTPSQVKDVVNVDIRKDALVNINNGAKFDLDTSDKWSGMIHNDGGDLTTIKFVNETATGGGLQQLSGTSTFKDNSHILISDANSYLRGGTVNIFDNSSLWIGAASSVLDVDTLKMDGNSLLNVMNNNIEVSNADNMFVNGLNNVNINISPRSHESDSILINNLMSDSQGTLKVADFNFLGASPVDRQIKIHVFDAKKIQNIEFTSTNKEIFTPIGYYDLKSIGGGYYASTLKRYNPQVFRGQVATMAMYNNQLAIDDMLLNHVSLHSERLLAQGQNANRYSINDIRFAPYQYTKEDGGLWFKSYVNFENLSMSQGIRAGNNSYGSIVGADFPIVNLKNGWKFLPTAYIGYNGSHQTFSHVGMYQNGGQGGFMGTFMKNDFVGAVLAYGGGYNNEMSVAGYTDNTGNWFAGSAAKLAYNLHTTEYFTIQPTAFVSYNIFGQQNWNTKFGSMGMNSSLLNGVNIAPGINFIYARETWNMYATIQYMYNINEQVGGRAGNIYLDTLEMRHGYLQYGLGISKTCKDRLNSFFQILFRNGGRTGVGFQFGLQYLFDFHNPVRVRHNDNATTIVSKPKAVVIKSLSGK